jgi:hypothetical protein
VFSYALETQIANLCVAERNFGLSFDRVSRQWFIILESNLDTISNFSLSYQGDTTNVQRDSSWLVRFQWTGEAYTVTYRFLEYIFESNKQTAFFVDYSNNNYDYTTDTLVKDRIDILGINNRPASADPLGFDYRWQINNSVIEPDGYVEPKKVVVGFYDANNDGQIDNPDAFDQIVAPASTSSQTTFNDKFIYFEISSDASRYSLLDDQTLITAYPDESFVNLSEAVDGELFYFYTPNVVKTYSAGSFILNNNYFAKAGRANIKFHYTHNTGEERRIDPSKSNIIDIYVLTAAYDSAYRAWLASGLTNNQPLAPTSQSLENDFAGTLEPIKSISDTLVFHPASYKVLFGNQSSPNLQATFKAVRNPTRSSSDNDLITRILASINDFFSLDNWEFGQSFNFTELATFVLNQMTPDIVNFIIVPKNPDLPFGSLFEIACQSNEILISGTTASDIEIINSVTAAEINSVSPIITNTNASF